MRTIFHGYLSIMTALSTIIFDVDGILLNTDEVYFSELQRALEEIHVDIDEKFFAEHGQDDCIDDVPLSKQQREQVLRTYSMHLSFDQRCHVLKKIEELPTLLARSFRPIS